MCLPFPGFVGHKNRNVFGVGAQEERLLCSTLEISEDAYPPVDRLVAITDRAEPDNVRGAISEATLDRRAVVYQTSC